MKEEDYVIGVLVYAWARKQQFYYVSEKVGSTFYTFYKGFLWNIYFLYWSKLWIGERVVKNEMNYRRGRIWRVSATDLDFSSRTAGDTGYKKWVVKCIFWRVIFNKTYHFLSFSFFFLQLSLCIIYVIWRAARNIPEVFIRVAIVVLFCESVYGVHLCVSFVFVTACREVSTSLRLESRAKS